MGFSAAAAAAEEGVTLREHDGADATAPQPPPPRVSMAEIQASGTFWLVKYRQRVIGHIAAAAKSRAEKRRSLKDRSLIAAANGTASGGGGGAGTDRQAASRACAVM